MVKLRNATARELLNSIIHYHFGQTLNGESLKEIGRPPSFTSAWFSQTMTLNSAGLNVSSVNIAFKIKARCADPVYLTIMKLFLPLMIIIIAMMLRMNLQLTKQMSILIYLPVPIRKKEGTPPRKLYSLLRLFATLCLHESGE